VDITYLADTVILLRYFEAMGKVRRAISIIKKRTGSHESTIREYRISSHGMTIGEPLEHSRACCAAFPLIWAPATRCSGRKPMTAIEATPSARSSSRRWGVTARWP
jgi:hypothetical protein